MVHTPTASASRTKAPVVEAVLPQGHLLSELPRMMGLEEDARGRILRAAAFLFHKQGYDRTTVRQLAQLVGIQSGSLFHHFPGKIDILIAVMEAAIVYNTGAMQAAVNSSPEPVAQLTALIHTELESIIGETVAAMAVLFHEWNVLTAEQQAPLLILRGRYEQLWLDTLEVIAQRGQLRQSPFIARRLLSGAIFWTVNWYRPTGSLTLDGLTEQVLAMVVTS